MKSPNPTRRKSELPPPSQASVRERILNAAFSAFMEKGYARTSTLEIATRAKVSKRELYALFGDKQGILATMIAQRTERMVKPLELPEVTDRKALIETLNKFGTNLLKEVTDPAVVAMHRLAIADADRSPELARLLDERGRQANRTALLAFLTRAKAARLLDGEPEGLCGQFLTALFSDLMLRLVMGVVPAPSARVCAERAHAATAAILGRDAAVAEKVATSSA